MLTSEMTNETMADEESGIYPSLESEEIGRTPFEYSAFACSMFMLSCCIVGIFGNAISVLIFTRPIMSSSINVLLSGLSVIDLLMLATSIPVFVLPNMNMYYKYTLLSDAYVKVIVLGVFQWGMCLQSASIFTFVLISCERYLAVCHPLKVSRLLSVGRARWALLGVVVTAIGYNIVRFFEYKLDDKSTELPGDTEVESPGYSPWLRRERVYFVFYHIGLYLVTHFLGPFIIITVLNVLILLAMRDSRALRARLINKRREDSVSCSISSAMSHKNSITTRQRSSKNKTTQMMVVVTAMFLVCNTLPFAINLWEAVMPQVFHSEDSNLQAISYLIVDLSNTLVVFNSASTFLLYIIYCKKYRQLFKWYCLAPVRLFNKDGEMTRKKLSLFDRNRANSLDEARYLTISTSGGTDPRDEPARRKFAAAFALPFLAKSKYSYSAPNCSRTSAPDAQESPRQASSVSIPSFDEVIATRL